MAAGKIADRKREGKREVWRITAKSGDTITCGSTVSKLIKEGLAWGHFPSNSGSAGITDAGKAEALRLGYWVKP